MPLGDLVPAVAVLEHRVGDDRVLLRRPALALLASLATNPRGGGGADAVGRGERLLQPRPAVADGVVGAARELGRDDPPARAQLEHAVADGLVLPARPLLAV